MILNKILARLSKELRATELGQRELVKYVEMQKTEGWKVYQSLVVTTANAMTQHLLSKEFTEQDEKTKDREQTAMFMAKSFFDFLLDPLKASVQGERIAFHNQQMGETLKGNRPKKGAK